MLLWQQLEGRFEALALAPLDDAAAVKGWLAEWDDLTKTFVEHYVALRNGADRKTDDEALSKELGAWEREVMPAFEKRAEVLKRRLVAAPHGATADPYYCQMLRGIRTDLEIYREENLPLESEVRGLISEYKKIQGAMTARIKGEEKPLAALGAHYLSVDRAERREAWLAARERRLVDATRLSEIFAEIVGRRQRMGRNAGFPGGFLPYCFVAEHRFDFGPAECEAFCAAVKKHIVPLLVRQDERKRAALGLDRLEPWDERATRFEGGPLVAAANEADFLAKGIRAVDRLLPEAATMLRAMQHGGALDLWARKGKAPGGYHWVRPKTELSIIFMNATGLQGDVETLFHELGHAYHALLARQQPLLVYHHSGGEFAEVASMTMELFSYDVWDELYDGEELARAKAEHTESIVSELVSVACADEFERGCYNGDTRTPYERWRALQEAYYPHVDRSSVSHALQGIGWQSTPHYFTHPCYMINYGIARLASLRFWAQWKKDKKQALAAYQKALALGGSVSLPELFQAGGMSFDFGEAAVAEGAAALSKPD